MTRHGRLQEFLYNRRLQPIGRQDDQPPPAVLARLRAGIIKSIRQQRKAGSSRKERIVDYLFDCFEGKPIQYKRKYEVLTPGDIWQAVSARMETPDGRSSMPVKRLTFALLFTESEI